MEDSERKLSGTGLNEMPSAVEVSIPRGNYEPLDPRYIEQVPHLKVYKYKHLWKKAIDRFRPKDLGIFGLYKKMMFEKRKAYNEYKALGLEPPKPGSAPGTQEMEEDEFSDDYEDDYEDGDWEGNYIGELPPDAPHRQVKPVRRDENGNIIPRKKKLKYRGSRPGSAVYEEVSKEELLRLRAKLWPSLDKVTPWRAGVKNQRTSENQLLVAPAFPDAQPRYLDYMKKPKSGEEEDNDLDYPYNRRQSQDGNTYTPGMAMYKVCIPVGPQTPSSSYYHGPAAPPTSYSFTPLSGGFQSLPPKNRPSSFESQGSFATNDSLRPFSQSYPHAQYPGQGSIPSTANSRFEYLIPFNMPDARTPESMLPKSRGRKRSPGKNGELPSIMSKPVVYSHGPTPPPDVAEFMETVRKNRISGKDRNVGRIHLKVENGKLHSLSSSMRKEAFDDPLDMERDTGLFPALPGSPRIRGYGPPPRCGSPDRIVSTISMGGVSVRTQSPELRFRMPSPRKKDGGVRLKDTGIAPPDTFECMSKVLDLGIERKARVKTGGKFVFPVKCDVKTSGGNVSRKVLDRRYTLRPKKQEQLWQSLTRSREHGLSRKFAPIATTVSLPNISTGTK